MSNDTVARVIDHVYGLGARPDWWKLEAQPSRAAWACIGTVIARRDPRCHGVVLLGLEATLNELAAAFRLAATSRWVRGFAVGRSIWAEAAQAWLGGQVDDAAAVTMMARNFAALAQAWGSAQQAEAA